MSRDPLASGRLTAQHYLLLRRLGWLLHPEIAEQVKHRKTLEIADVACGNAIWAMDMALEYPQAHITGIDISPQQFPPRFTWPEKVTLEMQDIFQPMPERFIGRFDIVHCRLIMAAVYGQNKDWVMQNIVRLLKPGGYIQWTDATVPLLQAMSDPARGRRTFREPPAITVQLTSLYGSTEWLRHLGQELQRHGLINLHDVDMPPVPWLSRQDTDNAVWALTDIREGMKLRAMREVSDSFGLAVEETLEDIRQGRVFFTTYYTTIGQKPR
ncbi:hypothetical protein G647_09987 [Cladophialophora carrionii CBS 160.54]|uniref:Methyltransferase domain-containing protein n=1 Tax=Cladophialophora carrionii CBS 160.54 TaxID=1279043 RepID=V9DKR5_9EURO|nr:uncharacterized protein G647_09987 [Cladophialophora carrionii CBS 160.54]ETI26888.1 hypothetical protein G647_09987 [Cladophialophora carrionii CBS 160.54]